MTSVSDDEAVLQRLGYQQELSRRMGGFSNFAISFSIICILAGGVTSFPQGFCAVGGAALGLGWPLVSLFSLIVAATMAQIASAYPTAGGLYHWAAILGGRGWGWVTAWFNLVGLIAVLAAINVGAVRFVAGWLQLELTPVSLPIAVAALTGLQGLLNHFGIRFTTRLTDFSGYLILGVWALLVLSLIGVIEHYEWSRLWTFTNFSGASGGGIIPDSSSLTWLFLVSLLLPAYTLTGFDASAHVAEETVSATQEVPRGIVRSVLVSSLCGWLMIVLVLLAMPDLTQAAEQGEHVFSWTLRQALPGWWAEILLGGIALAQLLCGLATVTSASRMMYAFARDGGVPGSYWLKQVSPRYHTPVYAIWSVSVLSALLTACVPYATIAAACAVLLYISYVLPIALGIQAHGRTWTVMGPWHLGRWYKPLSVLAVLGCLVLLGIGIQPPNQQAIAIVGGMLVLLTIGWWTVARRTFPGPPRQPA